MATQATSSSPSSTSFSSSSASSCPRWKYDVFISFCGVDTCMNFTDHLYTALKQKGIITFRNDEKLERGKYISSELLKAIEESKYAIIVLSTNYAFSRWCLIELAKIVKSMKETGLIILPVFYHMDPSDVRNQRGTLAEAFAKHEEDTRINIEDVQAWKAALKDVGDISGWHLHDRHESVIIQEIIGRIFSELYQKLPCVYEDLVGMDSCVEEMLDSYICEELGGVRFVGICGMGGMGKTTLALEIYRRISGNFEVRSFIANIREETKNQGLVSLQKQLLSKILMESEINIWDVCEGINVIRNTLCNKNVFIILDDVDGDEQLEALAGQHDWFGPGSRIIITSKDSHLLKRCGVDYIYTAKGLNNNDALQLFSWRAFHKPHPEENYVSLSKDFVNYAKGLPLALKVLGSSLFSKRSNEWKSALDKLNKEPNRSILDILQISFDGLTNSQKGLFLDIACFFKGKNKDCIRDILESFGCYLDYNIGFLMEKSLITIDEHGTLWMHDLLQYMGQEIVRGESPKEPGRRSRLWIDKDVIHVLKNNTGTEVVEGIMLNMSIQEVKHLSTIVFSKMKSLRLLIIGNMELPNKVLIRGNVTLPKDLSYLSDELRIIEWHGYPFKSMPTSFQPNKLVELRMHCSRIKHLWKGIMILDALKLMDLSDSQYLIEIPDLSKALKLKQLILRRCIRLYKIHTSLGDLKQLIRLDLNGCKCLEILPHKISLEALEIFDLGGCSRLKKFPEIVGNMSHLSKLCLSETALKDLPLSVEHLTGLIELDLRNCKYFSSLSNACCYLMSLKILTLSGCFKLDELPENLGNIKGLEELDVSGTAIRGLPLSIVQLKNLKVLSLSRCVGLSKPFNKLLSFPSMSRRGPNPMRMLVHSLSGLYSLTKLDLSYCNLQTIPDVFSNLPSLLKLSLKGNNFAYLPKSITQLSSLEELYLSGCTSLRSLPELPLNVKHIYAMECTSLETLSLRPEDDFWLNLHLTNCVKLIDNQGYGDLLLTMLWRYITQRNCNPKLWTYGFEMPGDEIPKWFNHQNVGPSLKLQVPLDLLCDKLIGIAVCVAYVFRQHHPLDKLEIAYAGFFKFTHKLLCSVMANQYQYTTRGISLTKDFGNVESNHLWLEYYPFQYFGEDWIEEFNQVDANGFSHILVGFESTSPSMEFTKCGAHLVYEQDIEDLKKIARGNSCSITPYEDDLDNSEKDIEVKRSHYESDGDRDGAGPSGQGTSNDADVLDLKGIQLPNLIERPIPHLGSWLRNLSTQEQDEKSKKQIVSEPHGMKLDVEAVKTTDSSEQKEFVIEEIGSEASQTRQPEDIHVEKMQPQALSPLKPQGVVFDVGEVKILTSSGQTESLIEDVEMEPKASEQCGLFLMRGGLGLTSPPKDEDWKNAKEIYLMDNELSVLPENPRCPNLSALFIPRNYKLRMIPPSFFDYMPALQILNLSRTSIKSLPDSVIRLVSLKRMFLNDCHRLMMLSPKVGDLEQLEILDLEGAKIMELPMEIKTLTNLKCLEVSFYGYMSNGRNAMQSNAVVPCGVISALSQLEELNIDVNPDDGRWDACVEDIVTEVCTLTRLETLKFYFPRVELLRHFQRNGSLLSHFRLTVGRHVKRIMSRVPPDVEFELERWERCLKYINGEGVPGDIKNLLHHVTAFFLDRHASVKKLSDFGTRNMKKLKCCVVGECNEVQVIIDAADAFGEDDTSEIVSESYDVERVVLGSLEYLYIYYMKSLRCIWEGSVQQNSLFLLKSLTLRTCPLLTTIFTQGLLDNLCNLEELKVEDCPSIKSIVSCGNSSELRTSNFLPNLKKILLHYMPGLVSISSGLHIAPQLEFLSIYNCPKLKNPLVDEVSCQDLKKIKGERSWWEALEWSNGRPCYLDEIFVPTDI